MVENGTWKFEQCTCQNMKPVVSDDSQTSLFS
jgi:hypothetical protein